MGNPKDGFSRDEAIFSPVSVEFVSFLMKQSSRVSIVVVVVVVVLVLVVLIVAFCFI